MNPSVAPSHGCLSLAPKAASGNRGNAQIGEGLEKSASYGGPRLLSQIAQIAGMSRPCYSNACMPTGGTSRESGALIRAGIASTVRNNRASIAGAPIAGTSKSDSEGSETVRTRSAAKRESGALIRAGVVGTVRNNRARIAGRPIVGTSKSASEVKRESGALIRAGVVGTVRNDRASIAGRPIAGTSKSASEVKRESGALIRAGVVGTVRNSRASIAHTPIAGTWKSDSESVETCRR